MEEKEYRVIDLFDQVLAKHLERLIGSRYGIGELPLNLTTIAALILLAEREKEIMNLPASSPDRYNKEILFKELSDTGLEEDKDMEKAFEGLVQKGYVDLNVRYRLKAKKPTISMVELLDRAFPRLPGLNLVAYFLQTIDEVDSDRKDIRLAVEQFDHMLQEQGVALRARREPIQPKVEPKTHFRPEPVVTGTHAPQGGDLSAVMKRGVNISNFAASIQSPQTDRLEEPFVENEDQCLQAESAAASEPDEADGGACTEPEPLHDVKSMDEPSDGSLSPSPDLDRPSEVPAYEDPKETPAESALDDRYGSQDREGEDRQERGDAETGILDDEVVGEQISEFQSRLNTRCPLCGTGKVEEKETLKRQIFYQCNNEKCSFISWGQPYHIECPLCKNPFLIEKNNPQGKSILKCPRATCRYWQIMPWETEDTLTEMPHAPSPGPMDIPEAPKKTVRRVRRRRVVRRKR